MLHFQVTPRNSWPGSSRSSLSKFCRVNVNGDASFVQGVSRVALVLQALGMRGWRVSSQWPLLQLNSKENTDWLLCSYGF